VKQIREMLDRGETTQASDALEQLLALGPKNTEALKLRAAIFEQQGRFADEAKVWEQVIRIDREDADALNYVLRRQIEDREHFYFTDDLPGGGRKFLAYPRSLITLSAAGLLGCLVFLIVSQMAGRVTALSQPFLLLGLFVVCVMAPWVAIIVNYFRMMKHVAVAPGGIEIATRFRRMAYAWEELETITLTHSFVGRDGGLALLVVPRDAAAPVVEINLEASRTSIRARSYLVREVGRASQRLGFSTRLDAALTASLANRRILRY